MDIDDDGDTLPDNNDSVVGTVNDCIELAVDDQIDIDLVVQGVDPADKIGGYQVDIDYDPAVISILNVVDVDPRGSAAPNDVTMISRINSTGGAGFLALTDISTNPNSITVAAADGTSDAFFHVAAVQAPPQMHEPGDDTNAIDDDFDGTVDEADEASQDGVLARITVQAIGAGTSVLNIPGPSGGADGAPDQIITGGTGTYQGLPIPITDIDLAAISVGEACVPPNFEPDVQIESLDCSSNPETVVITNMGAATQDPHRLAAHQEAADTPDYDLSLIGFGGPTAGTLLASESVTVFSNSQAPPDIDIALGEYPWEAPPASEKFRDFDISDFAQILDGQSTAVDTANCAASTATPTPTPQVTRTATPTPTPQGGVTQVPPTGDGIPTGDGSNLGWPLVGLGVVTALAAAGYVVYGRRRRREAD